VGWTPGGFEPTPAVVCVAGCTGEVEEAGKGSVGCVYGGNYDISVKKGRTKEGTDRRTRTLNNLTTSRTPSYSQ
jgi:hypothetical protein